MRIIGRVKLIVLSHGKLRVYESKNLITNAGKNLIRDMLLGSGFPPMAIAIGTGTTAADVNDVALQAEVFRSSLIRRLSGFHMATFQAFFTADDANGNTITELGLMNSTAFNQGVMLARTLCSPVAKNNATLLTGTWEWELI